MVAATTTVNRYKTCTIDICMAHGKKNREKRKKKLSKKGSAAEKERETKQHSNRTRRGGNTNKQFTIIVHDTEKVAEKESQSTKGSRSAAKSAVKKAILIRMVNRLFGFYLSVLMKSTNFLADLIVI